MTKRLVVFPLIFFILAKSYSQVSSLKKIKGTFIALWAETLWSYHFNSNNTYSYQTKGHFGNINTKGTYRILKDTIVLTAFSKNLQENPNSFFKNDTLIIDNDSCLIELTTGYEHHLHNSNTDTIYISRKRNLKLASRPVINED